MMASRLMRRTIASAALVSIAASCSSGGSSGDPNPSDPATSRSSDRETTHRRYCENLLTEEPRRQVGFSSRSAFIEDCIRAQFDYDDLYGENAP
jgi:hypothetical protein